MIDIIILITLLIGALVGFNKGLISIGLDLIGLLVSLVLGFLFYAKFGLVISNRFGILPIFGSLVSFLIIFILLRNLWAVLAVVMNNVIPVAFRVNFINQILGAVLGLFYNLIFVSVIIFSLVRYPLPMVKSYLQNSRLSPPLDNLAKQLVGRKSNIVDRVIKKVSQVYLSPPVGRSSKLNLTYTSLETDQTSENEMLDLVNSERGKNGINPLALDAGLQVVARSYARKMWTDQFFAHLDSSGNSLVERLSQANIDYFYSGENLAIAPSASQAQTGLMASPSHQRNILDPRFTKVGIGAISGGANRGIIFVQEFIK